MNKAILMGRLTKDPELRYTSANNTAVCSFTIAVNRKFSKQGEEKQADFIPIVAWDKTAEFCSKYFTKGQQVAVVGRIQTRTWDDNEGKKHYVTEVVAEEAFFADSKKGEGSVPKAPFGKSNDAEDGFYPITEDDELPF
jgi:single-strand DNA-binding protein